MGPRPFGRGRRRLTRGRGRRRSLQWGRDLSVAEGERRATPHLERLGASMGPRPFGRGRCHRRRARGVAPVASMGPRPFGRGRMIGRYSAFGADITLQWGRDLSVAEGREVVWPVRNDVIASMGPRPFGRGRKVGQCATFVEGLASMGPRPFGRGRVVAVVAAGRRSGCFNGAATFRSRKESAPRMCT